MTRACAIESESAYAPYGTLDVQGCEHLFERTLSTRKLFTCQLAEEKHYSAAS